jgi:hypothetical protein
MWHNVKTHTFPALAELRADTTWRNDFCYRLLCDTRLVKTEEIEGYLEDGCLVVPYDRPNSSATEPAIEDENLIAAICLNDTTLAKALHFAIWDCKFEEAENV